MFGRDRKRERIPARPLLATGFAVVLLAQSVSPAAAAVGDLDDTFDGNGKLLLDVTAGDDFLWDVAIQPGDQKIVGVGRRDPSDADWLIVRFNADGMLDNQFGGGDGMVSTEFSTGDDYAAALALQDDGKIVAAGYAAVAGGSFGVARYNTNGTLDSTFSGDGKATADFTTGLDYAWDVAIQADDRIVVAGVSGGSDPRFAVARFNSNGTLHTGFSGDGKATANLTAGVDEATSVALHADGRIVLAGYASGLGGQVGLARFATNGTLDPGLSGDGKQMTNISSGSDFAWEAAIQPADDKIVLGGRSASNARFVALRYTSSGAPDSTFSGNGNVLIDITSFEDVAYGMTLQADGKILLAGTAANEFFAVVRVTATGTIDATFGDDGTMIVNFTPGYDIATAVAVQADDNIVVVGSSSGSGGRISVMRLLGT